jgi:hypothetical protein
MVLEKWSLLLLHLCWFGGCRLQREKSVSSPAEVEELQEEILARIIRANRKTVFGRNHNFSAITGYRDFQEQVPCSIYDDYQEYLTAVLQGEQGILCQEEILFLQPSSGSSAASKLIPFTRSLSAEYARGIRSWLFYFFKQFGRGWPGRAYWSISPPAMEHPCKEIESKIPVCFADDAVYFACWEQFIVSRIMAVPPLVSRIRDIESFKYVTLLFLLGCENLRLISIWNPMFFMVLLNSLRAMLPELLADLKTGTLGRSQGIDPELQTALIRRLSPKPSRAAEIEKIFQQQQDRKPEEIKKIYQRIWPQLRVISCWADGFAASPALQLAALFPEVVLQAKGLLATEGLITYPVGQDNCARLAVGCHFYEFIALDNDTAPQSVFRAHELTVGREYEVMLTTSGGLYRYNLQDIVRVIRMDNGVPCLRFMGKNDLVSDLFGEKLHSCHVATVVARLIEEIACQPQLVFLAPEKRKTGYGYTLFVSDLAEDYAVDRLRDLLDDKLSENYHYAYCRQLGQLQKAAVFPISAADPLTVYLEKHLTAGKVMGGIKPLVLEKDRGWRQVFGQAEKNNGDGYGAS